MAEGKNPIVNQVAQDLLHDMGLGYTIEYNVSPASISRPDEGTQVRDPKRQAPPAGVRKYALAMANGDRFPAVLVDRDGNLLDGNTRHAAAQRAKVVLTVIRLRDDIGIAETKRIQAHLNSTHGEGLTKAEAQHVVIDVHFSGAGTDLGDIAASVGRPRNTVSRWIKAETFRRNAASVGVPADVIDALNEGTRVELGKLTSNEFIPATVNLVKDANLLASDIKDVVKAVTEAAAVSAHNAHEKIESLRANEYAAQITDMANGGRRRGAMAKHHKHLVYVTDYVNVEDVDEVPAATLSDVVALFNEIAEKAIAMRDRAAARRGQSEEFAA